MMVELKGSEKQIAWAEDIRKEKLAECHEKLEWEEKGAKEFFEKRKKENKLMVNNMSMIKDLI